MGKRGEQSAAIAGAVEPIGGRHAIDQGVGFLAGQAESGLEVGNDRDALEAAIEHLAGIEAGALAVDDGLDGKGFGMANQAMGRFAIKTGEILLAINNCAWQFFG